MPPGYVLIAGGYYMIESGSCGGGLILTTGGCEAAATALNLSDTTADGRYTSFTSSYFPPGCYISSSTSYLGVWGGGSTGSCSSSNQCICMFTPPSPPTPPPLPPSPPSPPSPPLPPPMPPGYVQIAGGYYMIESGSCSGGLIATTSECEDAATALDLSVKNAYDYTSGSDYAYDTSSAVPPGCVFGSSVYLAVYGGGSTGSCSSKYKCICMFTPPSPPPLPPPPPPSPPAPPMPPGYVLIAGGYYMIESGSCGGGLILTTG
eukprot:scaffold109819_cov84-Phaeocystis_antarctica.AAC.1